MADAVTWLKNFSVLLTCVHSNMRSGSTNSDGMRTKRRFPGHDKVSIKQTGSADDQKDIVGELIIQARDEQRSLLNASTFLDFANNNMPLKVA